METLRANIVKILIEGKNVTDDITPYLSRVSYTDNVEAESDDITLLFEDREGHWQEEWYPDQGTSLALIIGNPRAALDCGVFEIDEIGFETPPDQVTIKAIGAAISKSLRTKNSKSFEKQSLYEFARYFATKHGLIITGNTTSLQRISIERKTQDQQTDLSFLAGLSREYGIVFSVRGGQLIFIDTDELDAAPAIGTILKNDISEARFTDKTSQVYGAASVATRNMKTNAVRRWVITRTEIEGVSKSNIAMQDTYEVATTAEDDRQARAQALAALKNKDREKITGTISIAGDTRYVAGVNIEIPDMGRFSGKWHIVSSSHNVDASGYTTSLNIYKI